MSKEKTILDKIKIALGLEVKLEQITVDNGAATLEAESFEAGQPVFIVNEDDTNGEISFTITSSLLDQIFFETKEPKIPLSTIAKNLRHEINPILQSIIEQTTILDSNLSTKTIFLNITCHHRDKIKD